jgi:hypothetical protein
LLLLLSPVRRSKRREGRSKDEGGRRKAAAVVAFYLTCWRVARRFRERETVLPFAMHFYSDVRDEKKKKKSQTTTTTGWAPSSLSDPGLD